MVIRNIPLACTWFCILLSLSCTSSADEIKASQERGSGIVQAIERYELDHGHLPEQLAALTPEYLAIVPKSADDKDFIYKPDRLDGYYLCFDVSSKRNLGCCYNDRLRFWDCGFGD